jgi:CarD family transcriptional regulator
VTRGSQEKIPFRPIHRSGITPYQSIDQSFEVKQDDAMPMTPAMVTAALEATAAKIKSKDANSFRKGDAVVYPTHGVGRIDRVGFEEINGYRLNLIHISFEDNQMTLRVPVAQAHAAGLRKLASRTTMAAALLTLKGRPRVSRLMWAKRSQEYLAKINTSNPGALAEVVRDLQSAGDGSGSSFSQRNLFELALDRLAGELAAVNRIGKPDAIALLNRTLADARADSAIGCQRPDVGP